MDKNWSINKKISFFGYYQGVLSLVFAIGSILSSFIIKKYAQKNMLQISNQIIIISLISIVLTALINIKSPLIITIAFLPFIIGHIIPSNLLYPICLDLMPHAKGSITAILQGGRLIFASISLQIAGYFYDGTFRNVGIIISCFIFITIILMFFVIKNIFTAKNYSYI